MLLRRRVKAGGFLGQHARGLVNNHARRARSVLLTVNLYRFVQERVSIGLREVRRQVVLVELRLPAFHDDAFAALVEHVRDAGQEPAAVTTRRTLK